ncbi:hypothetical protein LCX93_11040 [Sulfurimonas sp. SWIR-19]|uniref:hypothetical protein n=1 Tax=Sulfurimonas sp. SWIR-19 TaxID=2878390 RepID=UPI001CF1A2E6|nr:hypothetical protein [Sulfurimonas sp. SWIR-19]UCN00050.1 hypothetical protein LCX93_11040 [Sulfurimonas sp. SWIR-19]
MQVKQENIKRPSLIEPFLNMELSPTTEFISYIDCSVKSSNVVHKKSNVTSTAHNIKKRLKSQKFNVSSHRVLFYPASRCLDIYDSKDKLILGVELQQDGDNLKVISTKSNNPNNIEKQLKKEIVLNKIERDYSGNFYTFLVDTEKETHRFSSEIQAVKFCIKNEFYGDIQVYYKDEWADYTNDIRDDIPDPIEIFNFQDSLHFVWISADIERESRNHTTMH